MRSDQGVGDLGLHDVGIFDIADRTGRAANQGGDAVVALAGNAGRPFDGVVGADRVLPAVGSDRQVRGEQEGRARAVRTVNNGDRQGRDVEARVPLGDGRVVPHGDVAGEDIGQDGARQLQLTGRNARDVDGRNHAADDGREHVQAVLVLLVEGQRLVGSAEIDRVGFDLLDAAAGTDGLIVELVAGRTVVAFRPLGVERSREGSAGAGDGGARMGAGGAEGKSRDERDGDSLEHGHLQNAIETGGKVRMPVEAFHDTFFIAG